MKYTEFPYPYDYQPLGAQKILDSLRGVRPHGPKRTRTFLYPTGSGKSTIWALALTDEPGLTVSAPNELITSGIFEALTGEPKESATRSSCEDLRIFTDERLLRCLKNGMTPPTFLGNDEGHHGIDERHKGAWELCGRCPRVWLTATGYRGTPQSTEEFRQANDSVEWGLKLGEAVTRRVISLPSFSTVPLLDDELVSVANGEFVIKSIESLVRNRVDAIVEYIRGYWSDPSHSGHHGTYAHPGTLVLPSVGAVSIMEQALTAAGLPWVSIIASTSHEQRLKAFQSTLSCSTLLLQIRAVGEGVDFPLRWMVDAAPTMSPMLWMQRVGRVTRPGGPSFYVSLCHNLLRHGYLWEGLIPGTAMAEARKVWGKDWKPSRRIMTRALGSSGFGRFAPTEVACADGQTAYLYALKAQLDSYACLLLPAHAEPYYFKRQDVYSGAEGKFKTPSGHMVTYKKKTRGTWSRVAALPDLDGCASYEPEKITEPMWEWWARKARTHGLDPTIEPNAKQFTLLPILSDTRMKVS